VNRSYASVFLEYGLCLIGPGAPGLWTNERDDREFEGSHVRKFATEPEPGDIVVLREGRSRALAVGVIAGRYQYLSQFDDVNGWDLNHGRRVRWVRLNKAHDFGSPVFGAVPRRFGEVRNEEVADFATRVVNSHGQDLELVRLPELPDEEPLAEKIPDFLEPTVSLAKQLSWLWRDEDGFGVPPREDESIVHLVVPLLRSLGWPPEQIAVKWNDIDVAVFADLPRVSENCRLVIEAKRPDQAIEGALGQAVGYVETHGLAADVIVTDGIRYRLFTADSDYRESLYANLVHLKQTGLIVFERIKAPASPTNNR
jgi:hypothetical protein